MPCRAVLLSAGDNAEIGKINKLVSQVENVKTNLLVQMEILGRWLAIIVALIAVGAFLLALLRAHEPFAEAFKSAVAIAVAMVRAVCRNSQAMRGLSRCRKYSMLAARPADAHYRHCCWLLWAAAGRLLTLLAADAAAPAAAFPAVDSRRASRCVRQCV